MKPLSTAVLILSLVAATACQEDLENISQVTKFRVLAVQTDPPELNPGEATALNVLTADPAGNGRKVVGAGFAVPGLITPSATEVSEEIPLFWTLAPNEATAGVISFGSLGVPEEAGSYIPPDDGEIDGQLKVTAVILLCAGDGLDELALLDAFLQLAEGGDGGFGESLDLSDLCVQAGADEGLTAFKTFTITNRATEDPYRNDNPEIDYLLFDETELPTTVEGGLGVFQCTSSDGCRNGVALEGWLTAESYQQYLKLEFEQLEIVDERTYISWFTDGGKFDKDRSGSNEPLGPYEAEWRPPREGGAFAVWAVAHDIRGGVSWKIYSVEAIPPP
jgi:hypothetical protein